MFLVIRLYLSNVNFIHRRVAMSAGSAGRSGNLSVMHRERSRIIRAGDEDSSQRQNEGGVYQFVISFGLSCLSAGAIGVVDFRLRPEL